jgi:hypothetical protein
MAAVAQEHEHMTPLKTSPQFDEMKKLVGKWEGTAFGHTITTEFRLTGGGSAIMQVMAYGQPEEMVTMYHMDGGRFMATHYCAAHNQPRMEAVSSSSANVVEFKYVDGTNIEPGTVRMENVKMTMLDADHHKELWTSTEGGKAVAGGSMEFDYHRVK